MRGQVGQPSGAAQHHPALVLHGGGGIQNQLDLSADFLVMTELDVTLELISAMPRAAWFTFSEMSLVITACSSMASDMEMTMSFMSSMTDMISAISLAVTVVTFWMAATVRRMFSVAAAVCWDSSLISPATTAKPRPAAPALAASMVAFKASRLVWEEMAAMLAVTEPISLAALPSWSMWRVVSAALTTASEVVRLASSALWATPEWSPPVRSWMRPRCRR